MELRERSVSKFLSRVLPDGIATVFLKRLEADTVDDTNLKDAWKHPSVVLLSIKLHPDKSFLDLKIIFRDKEKIDRHFVFRSAFCRKTCKSGSILVTFNMHNNYFLTASKHFLYLINVI